jgi:hypothetical protein
MIDPRKTYEEYKRLKDEIIKVTGFKGTIKRSLLYRAPEQLLLNDN